MAKLSVVISAFNEEEKLPDCLSSVAFADEIIVVDNESSDKTEQIAKKHKAKVFIKPNNLMLNVNKNFGFSKATGDWILNLDADERVSPELGEEIQALLKNDNTAEGYKMPRKNIIFGKWIRHTGWYPDYHTRLFKKGAGRFSEEHVHEQLVVEGEVGTLTHPLVHESYDSIAQFLHKTFVIYAPNEAAHLLKDGYVFSYKDAVQFPLKEFLGRYFARKGYQDGYHGFMLSFLMAFYHFVVFAYLWEKKKFLDEGINIHKLFAEEASVVNKEMKHWIYQNKIEETTNPLKKIFLKLQRKV